MIKLERNKNTYSILFNRLEDLKIKTIGIRMYYMCITIVILFLGIVNSFKLYFITGVLIAIFIENEDIFFIPIQLMKRKTKRVAP